MVHSQVGEACALARTGAAGVTRREATRAVVAVYVGPWRLV